MALVVADSDVLIDFLRGRANHDRLVSELVSGTLATTVISQFELLSGAGERTRSKTETLLAAMAVLPLDGPSAEAAAGVRRELEGAGDPIGTADYLIAGICLTRGCELLSRNVKHFSRVPGLVLANP